MTSDPFLATLLVLTGAAVILIVVADLVVTTIAAGEGAGPVTRRLADVVARVWCAVAPHRRHLLGPVVLVSTTTAWVSGLVLGWWAILLTVGLSTSSGNMPATAVQRLAFTITTISSLGPGYLVPTSSTARIVIALVSVSGLGLITLAISYVLPVISSVSLRRVQAMTISALGTSAASIIDTLSDPDDAEPFLRGITRDVRVLAQRHLAYPILHHFSSATRTAAYAPSLAALDEAATALTQTASPPRTFVTAQFHLAVDDLLTVIDHHIAGHLLDADPPWGSGLPSAPAAVDAERRRRLAAFVHDSGWTWEDVHPAAVQQQAGVTDVE